MTGGSSLLQVVGLAAIIGIAVLTGFWSALRFQGSPRLLSFCVGGVMGIIPGTILFEFLPALNVTLDIVLPLLVAATLGFLAAAVVHCLVRVGLPRRQAAEEVGTGAVIVAVVTNDVVEGFTLAFSGVLSARILLFAGIVFILKNALEGFTEATVLRWQDKSRKLIWAAGIATAAAVLLAAGASGWFAVSGVLDEGTQKKVFAAIIGALLYVSVFDLALNLEWNFIQKATALTGFLATGVVSLMVG